MSEIIERSIDSAYQAVNMALIQRNWLLGYRIAEEELGGEDRAKYGAEIIKKLSHELTGLYSRGYTKSNLYQFAQFYKAYPHIFQTPSGKYSLGLSWSHERARSWYAKEAAKQVWSVRALQRKRNISTQYYYRMWKTQAPEKVESEMKELTSSNQTDKLEFIKNPVIAEVSRFIQRENIYRNQLGKEHHQQFAEVFNGAWQGLRLCRKAAAHSY